MNTFAGMDGITRLDVINEKDDKNGWPTVEESLERAEPREDYIATGGDSSDVAEAVTATEAAIDGKQVSAMGVQVVDEVVVTDKDDANNNEVEVEAEASSSSDNNNLRRSTRRGRGVRKWFNMDGLQTTKYGVAM